MHEIHHVVLNHSYRKKMFSALRFGQQVYINGRRYNQMNIRDFIQRPVHFIRGSTWQQNDIHFLW